MNYYQQWLTKALPYVQHYFTDVTVHDRALFDAFPDTEFVGGMRKCGTNIIMFDGEKRSDANKDGVELFTFDPNHKFFHGANGTVSQVTRDAAMAIWHQYRSTC